MKEDIKEFFKKIIDDAVKRKDVSVFVSADIDECVSVSIYPYPVCNENEDDGCELFPPSKKRDSFV